MLHKTLTSYYSNDPWDKSENHPDGFLWLIAMEELSNIPYGILLEDVSGNELPHTSDLDTNEDMIFVTSQKGNTYTAYGLRGWRSRE